MPDERDGNPAQRLAELKGKNLALDMSRGQPSTEQLDLSRGLLTVLSSDDYVSRDGLDCRNYPGGVCGLPEAREVLLSNSRSTGNSDCCWQ